MFSINKPSFQLLEKSLDAATMRQRTITNNIANVDTPYFKRSDVTFESLLQKEMGTSPTLASYRTDARHFSFGGSLQQISPQISEDQASIMNNNLNNVDMDTEMSQMAKNQLSYNTEIQMVNHEFKIMRSAISGGK
ncbi:flagellar basal body rod protein FlgB [Paenibacillus psychroresistens]|uniref:Flagellar basal body rod protein FlgB n=1 Tax=Paenibacillus psychroresistens TaxID=1778678 RepID=A0A6B8RL34_9BACL|nr:flagellar basal body rod protein FlgB [Paenibacillus psychroresistens]QGQ96225.1 flagellar basal body rod protein FlgB [Paenibacillus psychroresistens]